MAPSYVPPVSLVLGANKDAYVAGLRNYKRNEVDGWIAQFARATRAAAQEAVRFSEQINELQHEWLGRFDRRYARTPSLGRSSPISQPSLTSP